jgi:hypothetical protein
MSFLRAASWLFGNWNQQGFWTLGTKIGGCSKACHVINNVQQFVKHWKFPFGWLISWNILLTHFHKLAYKHLNGFDCHTMIAFCPIGWLIKLLIKAKHGFNDSQYLLESLLMLTMPCYAWHTLHCIGPKSRTETQDQAVGSRDLCQVRNAIAKIGCWIFLAIGLAMRFVKVNSNCIEGGFLG